MAKLIYVVVGLLAVAGTALMVGAAPGGLGTASHEQSAMDIRALERAIDPKALPRRDLDPGVYQ